jgi:hypothetical protein
MWFSILLGSIGVTVVCLYGTVNITYSLPDVN